MRLLAARLVRLLLPSSDRDHVLDELEELYAMRERREGRRGAMRWYGRQIAKYAIQALLCGLKPRRTPGDTGAGLTRRVGPGRGEALGQDLRMALRALFREPGFTLTAVAIFGVGIGATTTIFSAVNGVLLRDLSYERPDELVQIWTQNRDGSRGNCSETNFLDFRREVGSLARVAALSGGRWHLEAESGARRISVARVSADLIPLLGVSPRLGRSFSAEEDMPGGEPVVVLSHGLWQASFGGRPDVIGRTLTLQGRPTTVIGVMPPSFRYPNSGVEAWVPLRIDPGNPYARVNHYLRIVGRRRESASLQQLNGELAAYASRAAERYPDTYSARRFGAYAVGLHEDVVGEARVLLSLLLGAVVLVLLIGCANVANLMLVRAEARGQNVAIHSALGAPRSRIIRTMLAESVILGAAGGVLGVLLALWGRSLLVTWAGDVIPRIDEVAIDPAVLLFTVGVSLGVGLLAGILPARRLAGGSLQDVLPRGGSLASPSRERRRAQRFLIGAEVALAAALSVSAVTLSRSFSGLVNLELGLRTDDVLTVRVAVPAAKYPDAPSLVSFYGELLERAHRLPGVRTVGLAEDLPLADRTGWTSIQIEGAEAETIAEAPVARIQRASAGYFTGFGIELMQGRHLSDDDGADRGLVATVNETFARQHFPEGEGVGRRIRMFDGRSPWMEIVGVVPDVRSAGAVDDPGSWIYVPYAQAAASAYYTPESVALVVRADRDAAALTAPVRELIRELEPAAATWGARTMGEIRRASIARWEYPTVLVDAFGVVAILLAAIGIYSLVSYSVGRRAREIGVRVALGADSGRAQRVIIGQMIPPIGVGLMSGLVGALWAGRLLQSLSFGVTPRDPVTFLVAAAALGSVALLATCLPARRAASVDPVRVLRSE